MTTKTGPDVLRKLADHYRDVIGWGAADSFKVLAGDWEAERATMNALEQRDETETMNIGAALFAVVLRDDTGAGEMPAGPCADVLTEWRRLRQAEAALERAQTQVALYEGRHPAQLGPEGREMSPRHRFNSDGICVRCGADAESDTGCVEELRAALERARALANELQNYAKDKEGEMPVMMAAVAGTMRGIGDRLAALLAPASGGAA